MVRRISKLLFSCVLLLAFSSSIVRGESYTIFGLGNSSCGTFIQAFKNSSSSIDRFYFISWIGGYLTATNYVSPNGHVVSGVDINGPVEWINLYCQKNPTDMVTQAVGAFVSFMRQKE